MTRTKNWKAYCKTAFNALSASVEDWGDPDFFRPITRIYYINVFDCASVNHLGLISEEALLNPKERTQDHCLSPQFVARMVYDNPDVWLTDFDKFKTLFLKCCQTIEVTSSENTKLSKLTENKDGQFSIFVATHKKYDHLGIVLFHQEKGVVRDVFEDLVPEELMNYESDYLVTT